MGSTPPAEPSRKPLDKHILWAIMLTMAFIIASGVFMVWFGLRILSRSIHVRVAGSPDRQVVTVRTPMGNLKISKEQNVSDHQLGLPIYPGAARVMDSHDDDTVSLAFNLPNQTNLWIAIAKFETPDPIKKVREFYKQQLAGEVTTFTQTDRNGKAVFEIKYGEQNKVVSLEPHDGGTRIALMRIFHGRAQPN